MTVIQLSIGLSAVLALAACASDIRPHGAAPPPPDPGPVLSQPRAPAAGAQASPPASEPAGTGPSSWSKSGVSQAQQRVDTEDCYSYALARVDNDIRIDNDIAAARGQDFTGQASFLRSSRQVDDFYYRRQRSVRFEGCMKDKGYSRN